MTNFQDLMLFFLVFSININLSFEDVEAHLTIPYNFDETLSIMNIEVANHNQDYKSLRNVKSGRFINMGYGGKNMT